MKLSALLALALAATLAFSCEMIDSAGTSEKGGPEDTKATDVGNPEDETRKPGGCAGTCYQLLMADLSSLGSKAKVTVTPKGGSNLTASTVEINLDESPEFTTELSPGAYDVVIEVDVGQSSSGKKQTIATEIEIVEGESTGQTAYEKDAFKKDETAIGVIQGVVADLDQAFIDRLAAQDALFFQALTYKFDESELEDEFAMPRRAIGTFSYAGLQSIDLLFPMDTWDLVQTVTDKDGVWYGITSHDLGVINPETGNLETIAMDEEMDLSWLAGLSYDEPRHRLLVSAGVSNYGWATLAAYDLTTKEWSVVVGEGFPDSAALIFMPSINTLYAVTDSYYEGRYVAGIDPETGAETSYLQLPENMRSLGRDFIGESTSFAVFGEYLAIVTHPKNNQDGMWDTRDIQSEVAIYLLDPLTGRFVVTKRPAWMDDIDKAPSRSTGACENDDDESAESNYVNPAAEGNQLAIISAYESARGGMTVTVPADGNTWDLLITAYEPLAVNVVVPDGALVGWVKLLTYEEGSTLTGLADGVGSIGKVDFPTARAWEPGKDVEDEFNAFIVGARKAAGLADSARERVFMGCYSGKDYHPGRLLSSTDE